MGRHDEEIERELALSDGLRPDEQEGPDASEASPARSQFRQGERMADPSDSQFESADELHESFPIEPIPVVMAEDGLPTMLTPDPSETQAIPFAFDTQLCVEDDREYVELFEEELEARGWTRQRRWFRRDRWLTPDGQAINLRVRSRYDEHGEGGDRCTFSPDDVHRRWGVDLVRSVESSARTNGNHTAAWWRPVRARRERCIHYRRQVFSNDSQPDPRMPMHQIVFRVCAARRSNGGAFMSLSNEGIYACDFREPYDVPSSRLQDRKDKKKLVERPDLKRVPLFGMPGDDVQVENNT